MDPNDPPEGNDPQTDETEAEAPVEATAAEGKDEEQNAPPVDPFFRRVRRRAISRLRGVRRSRVVLGLGVVLLILIIGWERCGIAGCPSVSRLASYQPGGASVLLDQAGNVFADLGPVDHSVVEIESLPEYVPAAFVAVEDKRFYKHNGVDWRRVVGAAAANIKAGRTTQGSSTITMQLSRNVFADRIRAADRTLRRKLLEVRVARDIERRFTKAEILELYLNHIYFGGGAYGIEAASRYYFGRSADKLTLDQAALLAAMPKAPANYDPRRHADRARTRRDLVLALMSQQGYVTAESADAAAGQPIRVASKRSRPAEERRGEYFVQVVRDMLEDRLGEDLYTRPLRIHTTLDMRAQKAAETELEAQIRRVESGSYGQFAGPKLADWSPGDAQTEYLQGAVVVLDNETGNVLALVGGRDARHSSFNRAINAHRQAGSAFKPFVYATALSRGYSSAQILDDSPYRLVGNDGKPWEPNNYDGNFLGPISMRDAFVFSRNVPTIRLASQVGEKNIAKLARSAGIEADLRETPMIALGIAEVTPLELTAAYTAFAGEGDAVEPRFVLRVEEADGQILWEPETRKQGVLDPAVAYLMTELMRDVVDRGTGRAVRQAGYRGIASGKTGTTNEGADAWFVGYTPRITAGIWVGFDQPREIASRASGGSVAAYAWGRMLSQMGSWAGGSPWEQPQRVIQVSLDPTTGLAIEDGCRPRNGEATTEFFLRDEAPRTTCPRRADAGGRSVFDRFANWVGGIFNDAGDSREVRIESERVRRDNDQTEQRRIQVPEPRVEQRRSGRESSRRSSRRDTEEWAEDLARIVDDAIDRRRDTDREALDLLRGLTRQLEDRASGDAADQVEQWLDSAIRSVERAAGEQRSTDQRRIEEWMQERVRELSRNGELDAGDRARIEGEIRRALREWM